MRLEDESPSYEDGITSFFTDIRGIGTSEVLFKSLEKPALMTNQLGISYDLQWGIR